MRARLRTTWRRSRTGSSSAESTVSQADGRPSRPTHEGERRPFGQQADEALQHLARRDRGQQVDVVDDQHDGLVESGEPVGQAGELHQVGGPQQGLQQAQLARPPVERVFEGRDPPFEARDTQPESLWTGLAHGSSPALSVHPHQALPKRPRRRCSTFQLSDRVTAS